MSFPESFENESPPKFEVDPDDLDSALTRVANRLIEADKAAEVIRRIRLSRSHRVLGSPNEFTPIAQATLNRHEAERDSLHKQVQIAGEILSILFPEVQDWPEKIEQRKMKLKQRSRDITKQE